MAQQTIVIRSTDRNSGTSTNCEIMVRTDLEGTYTVEHFLMGVDNYIYNVHSGNQTIYFEDSATGAPMSPNITPGIYSATNLATALKTAMDGVSSTTYTINYSATTNKFTFTPATGTVTFQFASNTANSAHQLCGFHLTDTSAAATVTSTYQVELWPNKSLFMRIFPNEAPTVVTSNYGHADILISAKQRLNTSWQLNHKLKFKKTSHLGFQICDDAGREATELQGLEWTLVLKKVTLKPADEIAIFAKRKIIDLQKNTSSDDVSRIQRMVGVLSNFL